MQFFVIVCLEAVMQLWLLALLRTAGLTSLITGLGFCFCYSCNLVLGCGLLSSYLHKFFVIVVVLQLAYNLVYNLANWFCSLADCCSFGTGVQFCKLVTVWL